MYVYVFAHLWVVCILAICGFCTWKKNSKKKEGRRYICFQCVIHIHMHIHNEVQPCIRYVHTVFRLQVVLCACMRKKHMNLHYKKAWICWNCCFFFKYRWCSIFRLEKFMEKFRSNVFIATTYDSSLWCKNHVSRPASSALPSYSSYTGRKNSYLCILPSKMANYIDQSH